MLLAEFSRISTPWRPSDKTDRGRSKSEPGNLFPKAQLSKAEKIRKCWTIHVENVRIFARRKTMKNLKTFHDSQLQGPKPHLILQQIPCRECHVRHEGKACCGYLWIIYLCILC